MRKKTRSEGNKIRGFRLPAKTFEQLNWLRFRQVDRNLSRLVTLAVDDLYAKHAGPRIP